MTKQFLFRFHTFLLLTGLALLGSGRLVMAQSRNPTAPVHDSPESYNQYRNLADGYLADGNYARAKLLYDAALQMPRHEKETYALQQRDRCQKILATQQQLASALAGKGNLDAIIAQLKSLLAENPKDKLTLERIAAQIEGNGTVRLSQGDLEGAMSHFIVAYTVVPANRLLYKTEQTNTRYAERFGKSMPQYVAFQQKLKSRQTTLRTWPIPNEYEPLRRAGDAAFTKGDFKTAYKKYRAAQQMPGHENDPYLLDQITKSQQQEAARITSGSSASVGQPQTVAELRQLLADNPNDASAKQALVQLLTQQGDALMQKQHYADARNRFEEALTYGETPDLRARVTEANEKIDALKAAKPEAVPAVAKAREPKKPHKAPITIVGLELTASTSYAIPTLTNQNGPVPSQSGLQPAGGLHLLVLPNNLVSVVTGLQLAPGGFMTVTESGTNKIESFRYTLAVVPAMLRLKLPLKKTAPVSLLLQGGVLFSRPLSFGYTNFAADVSTTDLDMLNRTLISVQAGLGLHLSLSQNRSVGLLATYQHTSNFFNDQFLDKASNRTAAKASLSGWGLQLVFRFF
jgi:tetratricopeptide (TPR) repeat protein